MKITPTQYQRVDQGVKALHENVADPSQSAKDRLLGMATDMVDQKGQIKSGYIKLVNTNDNQLRLGTRWSKASDNSTRDAVSYVRDLIGQAYGQEGPAMAALESYLRAKPGHIGTHSFVKLIRELEVVNPQGNGRADRLINAGVKANATMDTTAFKASAVHDTLIQQQDERLLTLPATVSQLDTTALSAPAVHDTLIQQLDEQLPTRPVTVSQWGEALGLGEHASASAVLAALRKNDPEAAHQLMSQLFRDETKPPVKNPPLPESGGINHVTEKAQIASKPDLSHSVTLLEMGAVPVDLSGLNLQGAQLLIRPKFNSLDFTHWGVNLSGADLSNTHIELDLSTGLKEKIDSNEIQIYKIAQGLLLNTMMDDQPPAGPGGGGVVGMIASVPSRFPALRASLTEQLLDFLNQHPSQAVEGRVQGWPGIALSVVALVDQFPELRDNPKIAEAAKRFASGVSKTASLSWIVTEIKDPTRPSPLVVQCGLNHCLAVSPEARKEFFIANSEKINILLDHAERVEDSHPEANEIRRLASQLEQSYLETEPFASLSKPFSDYGEKVRVLVSHDKKLNQSSALVIPPVQFQNMLINPGAVQWDLLSASRFAPNDPLPPKFIEAQSLRTDLPSLVAGLPTIQAAFQAPSINAASRAISQLFEKTPVVQSMMTSYLDRGVRATALGPEEVSDVFSQALEPLYENFKNIYDLNKWPEARLKADHLQQLLMLAKAEGLGNNKMAFARYLFVLSASLLKMSSFKGYGSDGVSVTSLRFYAHSLLAEAGRLVPELPVKSGDSYENLQDFDDSIRSDTCAELLSGSMISGAKLWMPYSSYRVLPIHFAAWNKANDPTKKTNENANLPDQQVY